MDAIALVQAAMAAIEAGDMAKAASYMTDDFVFSGPVPEPIGKDQFLGLQGGLVAAFPDWKFNATDLKAQGDKVTSTVHITGTHTATLDTHIPGMPPVPATGKKVALPPEPFAATIRGGKLAAFEAAQVPGGGVPGL